MSKLTKQQQERIAQALYREYRYLGVNLAGARHEVPREVRRGRPSRGAVHGGTDRDWPGPSEHDAPAGGASAPRPERIEVAQRQVHTLNHVHRLAVAVEPDAQSLALPLHHHLAFAVALAERFDLVDDKTGVGLEHLGLKLDVLTSEGVERDQAAHQGALHIVEFGVLE